MGINKRVIARTSSIVAFSIVLAASAVSTHTVSATEQKTGSATMAEMHTKLQTCAGAIAHIREDIVIDENAHIDVMKVEVATVGQSAEGQNLFG